MWLVFNKLKKSRTFVLCFNEELCYSWSVRNKVIIQQLGGYF